MSPMFMDFCYQLDDRAVQRVSKRMGSVPVMVKSRICHLRHMSRTQLVAAKEESTEMGGYFICNGIERIIRMLIQQRRHYIMALRRGAYRKRGSNYTDLATLLRYLPPPPPPPTPTPDRFSLVLETGLGTLWLAYQ
jgi:DNA-directed RNA polymerase I subunit RPA2